VEPPHSIRPSTSTQEKSSHTPRILARQTSPRKHLPGVRLDSYLERAMTEHTSATASSARPTLRVRSLAAAFVESNDMRMFQFTLDITGHMPAAAEPPRLGTMPSVSHTFQSFWNASSCGWSTQHCIAPLKPRPHEEAAHSIAPVPALITTVDMRAANPGFWPKPRPTCFRRLSLPFLDSSLNMPMLPQTCPLLRRLPRLS
jgi:hypothetical protein